MKISTEISTAAKIVREAKAVEYCATARDFVAHVDAVNDPSLANCLDLAFADRRFVKLFEEA